MTAPLSEEFILECELIALEKRRELGLASEERLEPAALAGLLAIGIVSIAHFREQNAADVRLLTKFDTEAFSAATVFCGRRCMIIYNPAHTEVEIRRSIAHELGHILLEHRPDWPIFDEATGERMGNLRQEAEADYLAGALLVPEAAVRALLDSEMLPAGLGASFGVSDEVLEERIEAYGNGLAKVAAGTTFGPGGEPIGPLDLNLAALVEELVAEERRGEGPSA